MSIYYCYQVWDYLEPDVTEMSFENDKEALDFWTKFAEMYCLTSCFSITRLFEVKGVFHEEFIAMFKQTKHGLEMIKSHAL